MSEQEKVHLWREAFFAKLEQTSNDPPLSPSHQSHEPGVRPTYLSKGKFPDYRSGFLSDDQLGAELNRIEESDDDDVSDLINWPDEGPSDVAAHRQEHMYDTADFPMDISSPQPWHDVLGRELLEPEVYTSPARDPVELAPDPDIQAFIYESAVRYQEELRSQTIKEYQLSKRREQMRAEAPPALPAEPTKTTMPIGLIYLWTSQTLVDPLHMGECTLGIYIIPEHRGKDCLVDAANEVIELAFKDPECHRLQSIIVENPDKLYNLDLLARACVFSCFSMPCK
jgi:RimJ/RimL family protein N-acetyltransferase